MIKLIQKEIKAQCHNRATAVVGVESGFWLLVLQDGIAI